MGAPAEPALVQAAHAPQAEDGKLTPTSLGAILAEPVPDNAIVSDEGAMAGLAAYASTCGASRHDPLTLTGGSIGQGLPVAVGAAVACPDRKVMAVHGDGGVMYLKPARP